MEVSERIIQEATKMFKNRGIKSVTMDDIAKEVGVSKRTIYEYFRDKDDLLRKSVLFSKKENDVCAGIIISTSSNILEAIYKVMYNVMSGMNQLNPSFITDLRKYHYNIWKEIILRHQEEQLKEMKVFFDKGFQDGYFRDDINFEIVTKMLSIQLRDISDEDIFPSEKYSRAEIFKNIIVNFTRGISTPKGLKIIDKLILQMEKNEFKTN